MAGELTQVGVREFREDLADYLDAQGPVAITRYGQIIGYYVPTRAKVSEVQLATLKKAVGQLETLLAEYGVSEDEVVSEFRARRSRS